MQKKDGTKATEEEIKQWREEFYKLQEKIRDFYSPKNLNTSEEEST